MNSLYLLMLLVALASSGPAGDFNVPVNAKQKRGELGFATRPYKEVGDRFRNYNRKVNKTHPFEMGIGYYYQYDIMLKPDFQQNAVSASTTNRWPNAVVSYQIIGTFNNSQTGCWSYVGRSLDNTYNLVNLHSPDCTEPATVAHEFTHAIGFYHEFMRPDRDTYITVNTSALLPQYQTTSFYNANFAKYSANQVELYGIPYYYGSVMHYSKYAGAANYKYPVMNNLKPWNGDFGNSTGLSAPDILAINYMYCNSTTTTTTKAPTTTTKPTTTTTKVTAKTTLKFVSILSSKHQ
ncbi:zinc metalloproteinase nas-14-like [Wyeomyia smithii]|uniref:zinc metalloproteinase nas-14-like n=1 Tax=Wyeomyia smithii TaxID=174621 RepID=UPI002467DCC7|nr:zinc metalloproteinase nas-14-like [Wyeomyia smithii]